MMTLFIQVLDEANACRFQKQIEVPAGTLTNPDGKLTDLFGVIEALQWYLAQPENSGVKVVPEDAIPPHPEMQKYELEVREHSPESLFNIPMRSIKVLTIKNALKERVVLLEIIAEDETVQTVIETKEALRLAEGLKSAAFECKSGKS
jgi:hypothetical protein